MPAADLEHVLTRTGPLWQELAGSRVFITGGTGFFGIWLLESIAAANDRLKVGVGATVLSRDPGSFLARMPHLARRSEFEWLRGAPSTFEFPGGRHDYLFHLATATSAHLGRTDPVEMLKTKLASISRMLYFARVARVRRVLVTSSGAVYGPQPCELAHIPESYRGAPDSMDQASAYGNGKRLIEQVCALAPEIDTVIARCFSFIGPHLPLDGRFAAGNFLRDALAGGPIVIQGDGRTVRSYLHAADLTAWLLAALVRGKAGRAYNVGSDEAVTVAQLADRLAKIAGGVDVCILGNAPPGDPSRYVPNVDRARAELDVALSIPLESALGRTYAWHRSHPEAHLASMPTA